jgi:acetyl-CoA acetyltransferase
MFSGPLKFFWSDRSEPMEKFMQRDKELFGESKTPFAIRLFANAGKEHMDKYGTTLTQFAKIAEKNHRHSANNPYSQFQEIYSLDEIMKSPMIHFPLTKLQCCPTSDGAAAAILCSESFIKKHGLEN